MELKHLLAYAPYDIKVNLTRHRFERNNVKLKPFSIVNSSFGSDWIIIKDVTYSISDIKPILRPLSDLTKEIEVNGEKFFIKDLGKDYWVQIYKLSQNGKNLLKCEYWFIQKLLELHFDIFNLIPNGQAIDINTL